MKESFSTMQLQSQCGAVVPLKTWTKYLNYRKRAIRVVFGTLYTLSRTTDNFSNLRWITCYDEVKINKCAVIYKSLHEESPAYISKLFKTNNSIQGRQTRHGRYKISCHGRYKISCPKLNSCKKSRISLQE